MVQVALGAAKLLEEIGIDAEVVDPRTIWPLDEKTLIESVKKTSRCIVIDEGYGRYGVTAELASVIAEGAFYDLDAPVKRHRRHARADSVLAAARRCHGADRAPGLRAARSCVTSRRGKAVRVGPRSNEARDRILTNSE